MKAPAAALARYRLQRAFEAAEDAATLEKAQRWNGAVNRPYYAAFYAAKALLATREIDAVRHSAAISLFSSILSNPAPSLSISRGSCQELSNSGRTQTMAITNRRLPKMSQGFATLLRHS